MRARERLEVLEVGRERHRRHVVGVAAERCDPQRGMDRVRSRIPTPAEPGQMCVRDAALRERTTKRGLSELRMAP